MDKILAKLFKKFNIVEKSWILYDVGNSAFTMMVSTLIPILFYALATDSGLSETQYLANWSVAVSVATIVVALLGPILGTISDNKGMKKPMFMVALFIGVAGCILMGLIPNWFAYLVLFVMTKVCYQASLVFYDSMLTDVTTEERMDLVSAQGYAWGYIGSCIPFVLALLCYVAGDMLHIIPSKLGYALGFLITGVWWLLVSMPLIKNYEQKYYVDNKEKIASSFKRLGNTLSHIVKNEKKVFLFLLAFFFYIDGVYTIISEAVAIGKTMGLDTIGLLVILLLTQVVAFAFASLFGKLSEKYESHKLIYVCIFGYFCVAIYALFMKTLWQFGIMAFIVGMFQGAIQALSRSYYAQIIPKDNSGEYFGLYDICGKGADFMGTMMIAVAMWATDNVNFAVGTLSILFIVGFFLLRKATAIKE